jgi:hypothetical protein
MLSTACLLVTEQVIINPPEIMNYSHWAVHLILTLALCGSLLFNWESITDRINTERQGD